MKEKLFILVVDDAPTIVKLVKELLARTYLVDTAASVMEAKIRLESRAYDLVLTDMVMPEAGGIELLKHVRLHHGDTPVIVLTGYANFQDAVQAVKLGAFDYLTKPIQAEILRHAIARALEFRRLAQVERDLEVIFQGAEALGWQALDLISETPEAAVLASLKEAGREVEDLAQVARRFLEGAQGLVGANRSSIFLYHAGENQFHGLAALGPAAEARSQAAVGVSDGVMGQMVHQQRPLLVADLDLDQRFSFLPRRYDYMSRSFMIIPLVGQRFWGVMNLTDREGGGPFSGRDLFLGWLLGRLLVEVLERLQPQAGLEQMPVLASLVQEHLPLGMALLQQDLTVIQANQALEELVRRPDQNLAGQEILPHLGLSLSDQERLGQSCLLALEQQEPQEVPSLKSCLNPLKPRFLNFKLIPALFRPETPQLIFLVEDVTEREQVEQRLHLFEHLAIMGKLSLCVAHELNNPLDGIRRYLSLAQRKKGEPGEVERYLTEAQKGLQKMSLTIRSLLTSANPLKAPKTTDNLLNLLHDAVKIMMFQASDQRVEVFLHPAPEFTLARVEADLYHVFVNLIKNALQSMPHGGALHIDGVFKDGQVEITFRDTGAGLTAEELQHIFLPFYTTKEDTKGLGLGLPICRKILERYQGQLLVESQPGQGTQVRLLLPREAVGGCRAA